MNLHHFTSYFSFRTNRKQRPELCHDQGQSQRSGSHGRHCDVQAGRCCVASQSEDCGVSSAPGLIARLSRMSGSFHVTMLLLLLRFSSSIQNDWLSSLARPRVKYSSKAGHNPGFSNQVPISKRSTLNPEVTSP